MVTSHEADKATLDATDQIGDPMTEQQKLDEDIRKNLELQLNTASNWTTMGAFRAEGLSCCVDGRCGHPVIGGAGGQIAEFVLGLTELQKMGKAVDVKAAFKAWQEKNGFYLHTDSHAIASLYKKLAADPKVSGNPELLATLGVDTHNADHHPDILKLEQEVLHPSTPEIAEILLPYLLEPDMQGCGHVKLSLKNAARYETSAEVWTQVISELYRSMWSAEKPHISQDKLPSGKTTNVEVLHGEHDENIVLQVILTRDGKPLTAEELTDDVEVPGITPDFMLDQKPFQLFVAHPQVLEVKRKDLAQTLSGSLSEPLTADELTQFEQRMTKTWGVQLGATLELLPAAQGKPIYTAFVDVKTRKLSDLQKVA